MQKRQPPCPRSSKLTDKGRLGDQVWTPVRCSSSRTSLQASQAQLPPRSSRSALCQSPEPCTARTKGIPACRSVGQLRQCRSTESLRRPPELRSCSELMPFTSQVASARPPPQVCCRESKAPDWGSSASVFSANSSTRASTRTPSPRSTCGHTPTHRSPTPRGRHTRRDGRRCLAGDLLSYHSRDRGAASIDTHDGNQDQESLEQLRIADRIISEKDSQIEALEGRIRTLEACFVTEVAKRSTAPSAPPVMPLGRREALDRPERLEDQLSSMFATVSEVRDYVFESTPSASSHEQVARASTESCIAEDWPKQASVRAPTRLEDRLAALSATISEVRAAVEHVSCSRNSLSRCSSMAASMSISALPPPEVRTVIEHSSSPAYTTSLSRASSLATSIIAPNEGDSSSEDFELATAADLEAVYLKSEDLVRAMAAVDCGEEVQHQWAALMMKNEDYKDRIARIEQLVARRAGQLASGDEELRLCRAVRGLCVGSQKPGRRWSIIS